MAAFLNDYTLLDEIGQGAFASVYKVRHNELGYTRAVRVLNHVIAKGEDDQLWHKFLDECRLLLRLGNGNNPHIVHIFQPLLRDSKALVEMDFIDGMDLGQYIESCNHLVDTQEVITLVQHMAKALSYCHHDIYRSCMDRDVDNLQDDPEDGSRVLIDNETEARLVKKYQVIHNDLHAKNIMRRNDGYGYVLLDFGLSIQDGDLLRSSKRQGGAPEYKSPEKWADQGTITTQSDIFSLGVILYEMLTGYVPFRFNKRLSNQIEAEYQLMNAIQSAQVPSVFEARSQAFEALNPDIAYVQDYPDWLEELIMKCLKKDPRDRFTSGRELLDFVEQHMPHDNFLDLGEEPDEDMEALRDECAMLRNQVYELQRQLRETDAAHKAAGQSPPPIPGKAGGESTGDKKAASWLDKFK